jgi:HK97 gp10 family phage protein
MQTTIHLDIPRIAILDASKARVILQEEVGKGMRRIVETMAASARRRAPVDRGVLRASITTQVLQKPGQTLLEATVRTGNQAPYATDVEYGTPPHWIQDISGLKGWARRVLGSERAAYAVRHSIAKHGTKAQPFMRPALEETKPQIPIIMQAAAAMAVQRLERP